MPIQTVPGQARELWAQACVRHIGDVFEAIERAGDPGLFKALAALMALPITMLPDRQASWCRAQQTTLCLLCIVQDEPLQEKDDDGESSPGWRLPVALQPTLLRLPFPAPWPMGTSPRPPRQLTLKSCSSPLPRSLQSFSVFTPKPKQPVCPHTKVA
jgi:hypothetical protein